MSKQLNKPEFLDSLLEHQRQSAPQREEYSQSGQYQPSSACSRLNTRSNRFV